MNILITGVAGFIGSRTAEKFLSAGHSVLGIDNFDPFYPRHFKMLNLESIQKHKAFSFVEGDILDAVFLDALFKKGKFDVVVHLAAKAGVRPSMDHIEEYYQT